MLLVYKKLYERSNSLIYTTGKYIASEYNININCLNATDLIIYNC